MDLSFLKGTQIVGIDIETTGVSTSKSFIREFGLCLFEDGIYKNGNSGLFSGGVCEAGALRVHGISDEMVNGKPTFSSKAVIAAKHLSNKIILGHNVIAFDLPIVIRALQSYSKDCKIIGDGPDGKIRVIDTLILARKYLKAPSNKLESLCAMYGLEHGGHRAKGDVISSWNVFLKIVEIMKINDLDKLITLV